MDWDKLRVFYGVTLAGSFTKASTTLNISQSAIGRQIHILEEELGTPLFRRVARGVELTEAGVTLRDTVFKVSSKLESTLGTLVDLKTHPWGPLHVVTTLAFGSVWLAPRLPEFLERYPDISVRLTFKSREDFILHDGEIGIASFPLSGADLIQTPSISRKLGIYASRIYLEHHGTPRTPRELKSHTLIAWGKNFADPDLPANWILKGAKSPQPSVCLVANNEQVVYEAIKSGMGIGMLPLYLAQQDSDMVEILLEAPPVNLSWHVFYYRHMATLKRVEAFISFITQKMNQEDW